MPLLVHLHLYCVLWFVWRVIFAGLANGISQSMVALTRAVGPALGSVLLAWSIGAALPFPLDYHFVFLLSAAICVFPILLSYLLGEDCNVK